MRLEYTQKQYEAEVEYLKQTLTQAELEYLEHLINHRRKLHPCDLIFPPHCQREVAINFEKTIHEKLKNKEVNPEHNIITLPKDLITYLSKLFYNRDSRLGHPKYPIGYATNQAYIIEKQILEILNHSQGIK
jgi:hypothetical protein